MKIKYLFYLSIHLLFIKIAVMGQSNIYYGRGMLVPLREEIGNTKYNVIQLAGGIEIQDIEGAEANYKISDHLGSTRVMIDGKLTNKLSCDYDAYGNLSSDIPESLKEQCRYTKTYRWSNTSQMYYSPTRVYQPTSKRFLSMDPQRQGYTAYGYALNNPIRYSDISGNINVDEVIQQIKSMKVFRQLYGFESNTGMNRELAYSTNLSSEQRELFTAKKNEVSKRIRTQLRPEVKTKIKQKQEAMGGATWDEAQLELIKSGEYRDIVFKHQLANCGECANVIMGELNRNFPQLNVESVAAKVDPKIMKTLSSVEQKSIVEALDHNYVVLNRNFSTPISDPFQWNDDAIVVDPWVGQAIGKETYATNQGLYDIRSIHPDAKLTSVLSIHGDANTSSTTVHASSQEETFGAVGGRTSSPLSFEEGTHFSTMTDEDFFVDMGTLSIGSRAGRPVP